MFELQWDETPFDELTEEQFNAVPADRWEGDPARAGLRVPAVFAEMAPGPALAAFLSVIDVSAIPGHDRVIVLRALQRMLSHYQAAVYEAMSSIVEVFDPEIDYTEAARSAAAEIRAALRLTRRAANSELGIAEALVDRLPRVHEALRYGLIDSRRARTLLHETDHLPREQARRVVELVLEDAPEMTTGELAASIRHLCVDEDPEAAKTRLESTVAERRVIAQPTPEGTTHIMGLDLSPDVASAAMSRINQLARSLKGRNEPRSMDQLRADVFADLLTGGPHNLRSKVEIRVDLATLAELNDHSGDLAGYGPVIADIARQIARTASQRTATVTDGNHIVHTGPVRRRPTATQRRTVEARNPTCVFVGCRTPASHSDLDHNHPWALYHQTETDNLAPFCRYDHVNRHKGWQVRRLPNGDYQLTSPLGHVYTTRRPP